MDENNKETQEVELEAKTEEENKQETVEQGDHIIFVNKEKREDGRPYDEVIETERSGLFKTYRSTMTRNNILLFVVAAVFIVGFIIIPQGGAGTVIGWVLIGLTMVGMIFYYAFNRKLYPNKSKHYIRAFWQETNNFIFDQHGFEDCYIDTTIVYKTAEVAADRLYLDIVDSASRNLVNGKYLGKGFVFGELALYKAGAKRKTKEVVFIGRHLAVSNDLHFEGRYIINVKGEKNLDLPTDLEGLTELYNEGSFVIYGAEGANYERDLGKKLIEKLKEFEVKDPLVNLNIALWAGRTACYLSYEDSIVAIPLEQKFNKDAYDSLKKNVKDIFAIVLGE